jgi:hypothetical protein
VSFHCTGRVVNSGEVRGAWKLKDPYWSRVCISVSGGSGKYQDTSSWGSLRCASKNMVNLFQNHGVG